MANYRNIEQYWIDEDWIGQRMLFLSGPRQVGKTELVRSRLCPDRGYFNWDSRKIRDRYRDDEHFFIQGLKPGDWVCFDEIHKRNAWKDILKGIYDEFKSQYRFVVTGSARLDWFKKSGDSLLGRYFLLHQFPINFGDLHKTPIKDFSTFSEIIELATGFGDSEYFEPLMQLGGFPEAFFKGTESFWRLWSRQHRDLILSEDLRDLSKIEEIDKLEILLERVRNQVGSPLSLRKTAGALETNHNSIKRWLLSLEKVHLIFKVPSFSSKLARITSTESKFYLVDWRSAIENRFENFVAAGLYRACTLWSDLLGRNISLQMARGYGLTEVDFIISEDNKPICAIEVKEGKPAASKFLIQLTQNWEIPAVVVTARPGYKAKTEAGIWMLSWSIFAQALP